VIIVEPQLTAAIGSQNVTKSSTVAGRKYGGPIAATASACTSAACFAKATASHCAAAPTWTISFNLCLRAASAQAVESARRSSTDIDKPSPVVPAINAPATPLAAKCAAIVSTPASRKRPLSSNGVNGAAIKPIRLSDLLFIEILAIRRNVRSDNRSLGLSN
jgi:hypothetical protein